MSKIISFHTPAAPTETTIGKAFAALAAANRARAAAEKAAEKAAAQEAQEEAAAYTPEAFAAIVAYMEARQQPTPNADGVHIGDLYYDIWGYEQTNVDFYQVISLKGKHTALIRRIKGDYIGGYDVQGKVRPCRDNFRDDEIYTVRTKTITTHDGKTFRRMADPLLKGHALDETDDFRTFGYSSYA